MREWCIFNALFAYTTTCIIPGATSRGLQGGDREEDKEGEQHLVTGSTKLLAVDRWRWWQERVKEGNNSSCLLVHTLDKTPHSGSGPLNRSLRRMQHFLFTC